MKDEKDGRFSAIFLRKAQNKLRERFLFRVISRVSRVIFFPSLCFVVSAFFILHSSFLSAQGPQWWFTRGAVDPNLTANDYAPITQGQLKWLALNAYYEMESYFGAGSNVTAVISAFPIVTNYLPSAAHGYPATIGQLKYVAQLFYDRLYALNLTNTFPANMPGYYPWGHAPQTNDFALANIGQAKYAFSFNSAKDSDGDGLSDWLEAKLGTNPYDPLSGSNFRITRYVFSAGGTRLVSSNFIMHATLGQPVAGLMISSNYILHVGYQRPVPAAPAVLQAEVRIEPEVLKVNPGILTAFVSLPEGFSISGIVSATCDGAQPERMMPNDDQTEMIMKFRRQDIEAALAEQGETLDIHFVVEGIWQGAAGAIPFAGEDDIARILN